MQKNEIKSRHSQFNAIKQVLEYFLLIIVLNYTTYKMDSISDAMINADFINSQTNQREIFHSINAMHLIQKTVVLILCTLFIKGLKPLLAKRLQIGENKTDKKQIKSSQNFRNQYDGQIQLRQSSQILSETNKFHYQSFSLTMYEQIFLGVTTFISIKMFITSQSKLNVIYIVISKYSNFLFVVLILHFVLIYFKSKKGEKLCTKENWKRFYQDIYAALPLGIGVIIIKLIMTQIPSYFRSYAGKSPQEPITFIDILVSALALLMDYILYIGLFLIKEKYTKTKNTTVEQAQKETQIQRELQPIYLLNSWTKYTVLIFFVYTFFTGDLLYLLKFISRHPKFLIYLIKISLFYFVGQWVTCRALLKYKHSVFFSTTIACGIFGKAQFYLFKSFNLLSLPYYLVLIGFYLITKQLIQEKNINQKIIPFQLNQDKEIKDYDQVDLDEKNVDYQQQSIDLENIHTETQQYQRYS